MNGINKTTFLAVSAVALIYSALCLALTILNFISSGYETIAFFLFFPYNGELGINISNYLPEAVNNIFGLYQALLTKIVGYIPMEDIQKYIVLLLVVLGFVLSAIGFSTKPAKDCDGTKNPVQYLWTHRPRAFLRCLAMPWDIIAAAWKKSKALVILPIILLPFYLPWSVMLTVMLIIPFAVAKLVIGSKIKSAAKREKKDYSKNTGAGVCPHCKQTFERPVIKCRCGLKIDYPVPNVYGYSYHTCNKGHDIPCESGKRGNLKTLCPLCGKDIQTREALPITISFVGAVGSGKTTMMLAAAQKITQSARKMDVTVDTTSAGLSKAALSAKDYAPKTASGELESQCLFIRSMNFREREIIFNDISGTEFQANPDKVLFEEYYNYTNGIVFAFDPMSLKREIKKDTPGEVFDSFHFMYTRIRNISPYEKSDVPFAVVATKSDVMKPALRDGDVRQYLIDNGESNFVRIMESVFTDVKYFSVTSVGEKCGSSMRPIWWIAGHTDKELPNVIPIEE